jgi:hypothetical protein
MKELEVIPPVEKALIKNELTRDRFLRLTNNAFNEIYVINAHNAPNVMREVGRLRELSFRQAGGGTGKDCDIDAYDTAPIPYEQLIVWDPQAEEIIGGYRFIHGARAEKQSDGTPKLATRGLFNFSKQFIEDYLPYTIELGRSFVQPAYQPSRENRKSIYSLDNLWDGLGALVIDNPDVKYFYGKVTMYTHYDPFARDLILYFLKRFFPDPDQLVTPIEPLTYHHPEEKMREVFCGQTTEENMKILSQEVRRQNENIPPLINSYMGLSPTMKSFGTVLNYEFGGVEETGILITIADIFPAKSERHVKTYLDQKKV